MWPTKLIWKISSDARHARRHRRPFTAAHVPPAHEIPRARPPRPSLTIYFLYVRRAANNTALPSFPHARSPPIDDVALPSFDRSSPVTNPLPRTEKQPYRPTKPYCYFFVPKNVHSLGQDKTVGLSVIQAITQSEFTWA